MGRIAALGLVLVLAAGCAASAKEESAEASASALSDARIDVGRRLFYDRRLSANERQSCATCHVQRLAFTDGLNRAVGSEGDLHSRNSPSLVNLATFESLTWLAPGLVDLATQAARPLLGVSPIVELGMGGRESELSARLRADAYYAEAMPRAFPGVSDPFTTPAVLEALAAFERTIVSRASPYDRYLAGDLSALDAAARHGRELFFGRLGCARCHGGVDLNAPTPEARAAGAAGGFANDALYDVDGRGGYPSLDRGLIALTGRAEDEGRFRIPSLRNVAVTAPYMHDGSVATLGDVVTMYARGGRQLVSGPYVGDGARSPRKHPMLEGFAIDESEREALLSFLGSLTDDDLLHRPDLADPFVGPDAGAE